MIAIFVFTEGEFDDVLFRPTRAEAVSFADGVSYGAGLYGCGNIGAYVLPEDEADMVESESPKEIAEAHERHHRSLALRKDLGL